MFLNRTYSSFARCKSSSSILCKRLTKEVTCRSIATLGTAGNANTCATSVPSPFSWNNTNEREKQNCLKNYHRKYTSSKTLQFEKSNISKKATLQDSDYDGDYELESKLRYDLAVAHQITDKIGMDTMLTWNHISARYKDGWLITPGDKLWNQIQPSDLLLSSNNITADIIHSAIYEARDDVNAIMHLHTPAAAAISCLQTGFVPLIQDAAYFYDKVVDYKWDGVSNDIGEGPALMKAVQSIPDCNTLLLQNHGYVCFGKSVKEAWMLAYYFDRCCEVQIRVMQATGGVIHDKSKVVLPPKDVMEEAAKTSYLPEFAPGECEWDAICNEISFD